MPVEIDCPRCGVRLLIRDGSPVRMTCPRCLCIVINPQAGQGGPLRVLPLERDVATDARGTSIGLLILGIVLLVSAVVIVAGGRTLLIPGFLFIGGVGAIWGAVAARVKAPSLPSDAADMPHNQPDDRYLAYQSHQAYRDEPGLRALPFICGFFGSLGMCGVIFVIFLGTLNAAQLTRQGLVLTALAVLTAVAIGSGYLGKRPGFSGIGRGTAIGLALGMFALGPCAFCYALM